MQPTHRSTIATAMLLTALTVSPAAFALEKTKAKTPVAGRLVQTNPAAKVVTIQFGRMREGTPVRLTGVVLNRKSDPVTREFVLPAMIGAKGTIVFGPNGIAGLPGAFSVAQAAFAQVGRELFDIDGRQLHVRAERVSRAEWQRLFLPGQAPDLKARPHASGFRPTKSLIADLKGLLAWQGGFEGKGMKITARSTVTTAEDIQQSARAGVQQAYEAATKNKNAPSFEQALGQGLIQEVQWTAQAEQGIAYRFTVGQKPYFAGASLGLPEKGGADLSFEAPR